MASTSTAPASQQPAIANKLSLATDPDAPDAKAALPPMGPASTLGSSDHTQATRTSSNNATEKSPDARKVELNGNSFAIDLFSARVTYHDGFNKTGNMNATAQSKANAQDVKNRTIGHYVVGKPQAS